LAYSTLLVTNQDSHILLMLTMLDLKLTDALPLDSVLSMGIILSHGKVRSRAVVSRSSAEAEYRAMAQGTCEILWLRSICNELGFMETDSSQLFCDNKSAIMSCFRFCSA
jgi:hypothetical protein